MFEKYKGNQANCNFNKTIRDYTEGFTNWKTFVKKDQISCMYTSFLLSEFTKLRLCFCLHQSNILNDTEQSSVIKISWAWSCEQWHWSQLAIGLVQLRWKYSYQCQNLCVKKQYLLRNRATKTLVSYPMEFDLSFWVSREPENAEPAESGDQKSRNPESQSFISLGIQWHVM